MTEPRFAIIFCAPLPSADIFLQVAEYQVNLGTLCVKTAKFAEAKERYREALQIYMDVLGPTSPRIAEVLNSIGILSKKCSEYLSRFISIHIASEFGEDT